MTSYKLINENELAHVQKTYHSSFPIIQSVIDGVQQGSIFINSQNDCWVLHKAGFSEVFLKNDAGTEWIDFIAGSMKLPQYFHLYNPAGKLINYLQLRNETFNIRVRGRIQLSYENQSPIKDSLNDLDDGFTLSNITNNNFESLSVFNLDLGSKFWKSKNEFIKHALGVVVSNKEDMPVSLCYAAAVADQRAEIDVVTLENYRGKGLAKTVVNSFINSCMANNLFPNWDCFEDNTSSLDAALKLGFFKNKFYNFISVYRK